MPPMDIDRKFNVVFSRLEGRRQPDLKYWWSTVESYPDTHFFFENAFSIQVFRS